MTTTLDHPTPTRPSRPGPLRIALATVAVLATLPYVVLKLLWLSGSGVGLADPDAFSDPVMVTANAVTLLMELTAAGLAVLLVLEVGRRIPAAVVHVPMFVGTGLLGGILVVLPVEAVRRSLSSPSAGPSTGPSTAQGNATDSPIADWVFAMVYGGFGVLGLSLLAIFALHAWDRWIRPGGWTTRVSAWVPTSARQRRLTVVHGVGMVVICTAGLLVAARADLVGSHDVVAVLMALVSSAGLIALALRSPGSVRGSTALVMAYAGAAVVAAWGLYFFVVLVLPNPLRGDEPVPAGLLALELLRGVSGVMTAFAAARLGRVGHR
ncbi:hypothetical protein LL946_05365 [Knoellia locipacati]|uniref:hypothetical protein n=1 Tax=Knoellia locipacati TaxID=882824 RepID=UPI00384F71CC